MSSMGKRNLPGKSIFKPRYSCNLTCIVLGERDGPGKSNNPIIRRSWSIKVLLYHTKQNQKTEKKDINKLSIKK